MSEEKLVAYIKKEVDKGIDKDRIRTALEGAGYPQERISEAFTEYDEMYPEAHEDVESVAAEPHVTESQPEESTEPTDSGEAEPEPTHHRHRVLWPVLTILILVILGAGGWFAWNQYNLGDMLSSEPAVEEVVSTTNLAVDKLTRYKLSCEAAVKSGVDMCNDVMQRPNSACEKQKVARDKNKCHDAVHYANAMQGQDATICENIQSINVKKKCRLQFKVSEPENCEGLNDDVQRGICNALVGGSAGSCAQLEIDIMESVYACKVYSRSSN